MVVVVLTIFLFAISNRNSFRWISIIVVWSGLQAILAAQGFYTDTTSLPPRFLMVLVPTLLILIISFKKKNLEKAASSRNLELSTFLHSVRLPVEIVLYFLFTYELVPELMTFRGWNLDIIAGLSAPVVGVLFLKKIIGNKFLLTWNVIGLMLIVFVFTTAILSSELPIQLLAFEQPMKAPIYFPYIILPATIVPIVIWTHVVDIYKLLKK